MATDENHLIELEIKISHQEVAIEELQEGVYQQHLLIDKLQKSLDALTKRFESLVSGDGEIGPAGEKPPHY